MNRTNENSRYQGYSNYETFLYAIHTNQVKSNYDYVRELAKCFLEGCEGTEVLSPKEHAIFELADCLEDMASQSMFANTELADCLLTSAIKKINFDEFARSIIEEVVEQKI